MINSSHATVTETEKNCALIIHLSTFLGYIIPIFGFLAPIFFWKIKKDISGFVDEHGKEASNFALTICLLGIAPLILAMLIQLIVLRYPAHDPQDLSWLYIMMGVMTIIAVVLGLWFIVSTILAAYSAGKGRPYRHRPCFRFFK